MSRLAERELCYRGLHCGAEQTIAVRCCFPARIIAHPSFHPATSSTAVTVIFLVLQKEGCTAQSQTLLLLMPGGDSVAEPRFPALPRPCILPHAWETENWETKQVEELGTALLKLCLCLGGGPGAAGVDSNVALHVTPSVLQLWEQQRTLQPCSEAR